MRFACIILETEREGALMRQGGGHQCSEGGVKSSQGRITERNVIGVSTEARLLGPVQCAGSVI